MKKEIRIEAIGGQGANSAGKILAEAAVLGMGFAGNHFSSFGSEKRGSPVRSSVRYSDNGETIRSSAPVARPDCIVIFHESLISRDLSTCEGSSATTNILVNSAHPPEQMQFFRDFRCAQVGTVDAYPLANRFRSGLNAVMLGALSTFCAEISLESLEAAFRRFFSHLAPEALEANLRALRAGRAEVKTLAYRAHGTNVFSGKASLPVMGYENAPIGGVVSNPGNTVLRDYSFSRKGTIPLLDSDKCLHCGQCDMVCPDYCFVWNKSVIENAVTISPEGKEFKQERQVGVPLLQGIDYRYCKGCQKCVRACPFGALSLGRDTEKNRRISGRDRYSVLRSQGAFPIYSENDD